MVSDFDPREVVLVWPERKRKQKFKLREGETKLDHIDRRIDYVQARVFTALKAEHGWHMRQGFGSEHGDDYCACDNCERYRLWAGLESRVPFPPID